MGDNTIYIQSKQFDMLETDISWKYWDILFIFNTNKWCFGNNYNLKILRQKGLYLGTIYNQKSLYFGDNYQLRIYWEITIYNQYKTDDTLRTNIIRKYWNKKVCIKSKNV